MDRDETVELAEELMQVGIDLHTGGDSVEAMHHLVELAVKHLRGCAWASITVSSHGRTAILVTTDEVAERSVRREGDGALSYALVGTREPRLTVHPEPGMGFDGVTTANAAMFAAHASSLLALSDTLDTVAGLEVALAGCRDIGVAIGVLMTRRNLSRDAAFDVLRRASQHSQVKLRDVAAGFLQSGRLPNPPKPSTSTPPRERRQHD